MNKLQEALKKFNEDFGAKEKEDKKTEEPTAAQQNQGKNQSSGRVPWFYSKKVLEARKGRKKP